MSNQNYEKVQSDGLNMPEPPPYSEKQPYGGPEPAAPMVGYGATPAMPPLYQPGPVLQPPQSVFVTPVQPSNEPDYLAYSIFTMLCCCLPLGIASLVYSIQTREANHMGNRAAAQRNSRMARILAHTALGVGLAFTVLYIVFVVVIYNVH
ncbi:proline rich transmembrane protein 1B [Pogona vitticeps]|uniref:Proline rich transmembrane protein 1B-like n=1 Tax=Pogona vitticeps TaxID=103695 RepID=A0A6J0V3N8_9SAUR|nr:tumor suppressor candidate 5 homolog [Pogona vitticeps]